MAKQLNRMQFLHGDFKAEAAFRPPWAIEESLFTDACDRCDKCINACPSKILQRGSAGFPEVNYSKGGCDFCQVCVDICPTQALLINQSNKRQPWNQVATFKNNCLSENGVVCRSCGDVCESRAIKFKMTVGGSATVEMNPDECNGCGECISFCPIGAIEMKKLQINDQLEINP